MIFSQPAAIMKVSKVYFGTGRGYPADGPEPEPAGANGLLSR